MVSTPSTRSAPGIGQLIARRAHDDPAQPLVVWYGPGDERVELSAVTFANWVDKTLNLLGELGWDEAPVVAAPLVAERPGHWTSLVWCAATWSLGGELRTAGREAAGIEDADVVVLGPELPAPVAGTDTIACSLHPFGLALPHAVGGVLDYHDVLAQPDIGPPLSAPEPGATAWVTDERSLTHADLVAAAGEPGRALVPAPVDADPVEVVRAGLLAPLLGGGSAVVVEGTDDPARLDRIATAEHAHR